jgi:hypothetical protein
MDFNHRLGIKSWRVFSSEDSVIDLENGNDIKFTKLKNKAIREQSKLSKAAEELVKEREKLEVGERALYSKCSLLTYFIVERKMGF